jgi:hypothetical protein
MITREKERAWDLLVFERRSVMKYSVPQPYDICGLNRPYSELFDIPSTFKTFQ